jgi:hypothetical protein
MDMTELFTYRIITIFIIIIVVRKKKKGKKEGEKRRIIHLAREHHRISSRRRTWAEQRAALVSIPSLIPGSDGIPVVLVS